MDDERNEPTDRSPRHALLAGGGSGGHVYPGLAVAEVLAARGWIVTWAGRPCGMERSLVERAGLPYVELSAAPLVGQGLWGRVRALVTLLLSALAGRRLIRRLGADAVIGTGGYVCAPAVLGARLAGAPSLLVEPNAVAGAANRLLSKWSTAAALAYEGSADDFACRTEVTGVPVRSEFFRVPPLGSELRSGGGDAPGLLVVGGSQGAAQINELLPPALEAVARHAGELRVVHQAGATHEERLQGEYASRALGGIEVEVLGFLDDMPAAMAGADLVISRAGAITLAELCAAGRPSLLIPLRHAGGHQLANARKLESSGAAVVPASGDLDPATLATLLSGLLFDRERLSAMAVAARSLAHESAAQRIVELVEELGEAA